MSYPLDREDAEPTAQDPGLTPRSFKACATCRARKVRCIIEDRSPGSKCIQCLKDSRDCIFEPKKRTYDTSTRTRRAREKRARLSAPEKSPSPETSTHDGLNIRTSADALLYLSGASTRHGDDAALRSNLGQATSTTGPDHTPSTHNNDDVATLRAIDGHSTSGRAQSPPSPCDNPHIQDSMSTFRCRLFYEHIVTPNEALVLVSFFFRNLYPFFPFLPDVYYTCFTKANPDPDQLRSLFEDDDILLGCIITVSSRYCHLPKCAVGGYERSCDIHNSSWQWTRQQVSRVVFDGVRPRSVLSVVETLLMLAEWLPKPIHAMVENNSQQLGNPAMRESSSKFVSDVILQPAFRTDQVSWTYVGNAFLLLRSIVPNRRICPVTKSSNRYLVTLFSCLIMSQSLGRRLSRPGLMTFDDVDLAQISKAFRERNERLALSSRDTGSDLDLSLGISDRPHNAFVELMKLLAQAQHVLHPPTCDGIVEPRPEAFETPSRLITLLQHFDTLNNGWRSQFIDLIESSESGMSDLSRLILQLDFDYLRLYEFSIALGTYLKLPDGQRDSFIGTGRNLTDVPGNDWEFASNSFAYYVEQSIDAAEGLLRVLLYVHSPQRKGSLRYASSRYYMKIVFAAVFLIQVLRTSIPSEAYRTILITTLKDAVVTLEGCSIDAAHPALRYSILLRGLMRDIEQPKVSFSVSIHSLIIGPRENRQSDTLLKALGPLSPMPRTQVEPSLERDHWQADAANQQSLPYNNTLHWSSATGYPESERWPETDNSALEWENLIAELDTETFLQSLIGASVFPMVE